MKGETLLDKALAVKVKINNRKLSSGRDPEEVLELALAYATRRVTTTQVSKALGYKIGSCGATVVNSALMSAIRRGQIGLVDLRDNKK